MSNSNEILVLHAVGEELRLAQVRVIANQIELGDSCSFWSSRTDEDASVLHDQTVLDALASYVKERGWHGRDLLCVLGGSSIACQQYELPPLSGESLKRAATLKLSNQLHFDVSEAIIAVKSHGQVAGEDGSQILVSVTAAHKPLATAAMDAATRMGLNVRAVVAAPDVLASVVQEKAADSKGLKAFLQIDELSSTLIVLNGQQPCVTTELPVGLESFTAALMRPIISGDDVIQIEREQATSLRNEAGIPKPDQEIPSLGITGGRLLPLLEPVLQQFAKHLTQWLTFASTSAEAEAIDSLTLIGSGGSLPGLSEALGARMSFSVTVAEWLADVTADSDTFPAGSMETFLVPVGAIRHWQSLPDLLPPEVRRERRLRRIRRAVAISGPIVASVIVGFAVMFDRMGGGVLTDLSEKQQQLADVQKVIGDNGRFEVDRKVAEQIEKQIADFSQSTPSWIGVFKELSVLLPSEVQAAEFAVADRDGRLWLVVNGSVHNTDKGQDFDRVVEQTLLLLQRSPFFGNVELLLANRVLPSEDATLVGRIGVELELAYPRCEPEA